MCTLGFVCSLGVTYTTVVRNLHITTGYSSIRARTAILNLASGYRVPSWYSTRNFTIQGGGGALNGAMVLQNNILFLNELPHNFKNSMGVALYGDPSF
jgi:hypothetical protein